MQPQVVATGPKQRQKRRDRVAFNGLGLAIVRALPGQAGTITLKAESVSLPDGAATQRIEALRR